MTNGTSPSGWYQDPTGQGDSRYWNGVAWTESVNRGGAVVNVAIDPSQAQTPPAPGTQVAPPAQQYVPPPPPPAQTVNVSESPHHSVLGVIFGALAVLFLVVLLYAAISSNDSGGDTPTPGTNAPAEEPAPEPANDAPAEDGG